MVVDTLLKRGGVSKQLCVNSQRAELNAELVFVVFSSVRVFARESTLYCHEYRVDYNEVS